VRRELHWRSESTTVDYPPFVLGELALAGRLCRHFRPHSTTPLADRCVKLPGLIFEAGFVALVLARPALARRRRALAAMAFWLNRSSF
jgi:hypothetical protein